MLKVDTKHKDYEGKILTSAGIGKGYENSYNSKLNKYLENKTKETYICKNGARIALPIYYRNKLYKEEEREKLWLEKLDKQERYVLGKKIKVDTEEGEKNYELTLKEAQKKNKDLGYGSDVITWQQDQYNRERRKLKIAQRLKKIEK